MCVCVVSEFNTDITPSHLLCHSSRSTGAKETVKNYIASVTSKSNYPFDESFWLRGLKWILIVWKQLFYFFFRLLIIANLISKPYCFTCNSLLYLR